MNIKQESLCVVVGKPETPGLLNRFVIAERPGYPGASLGPNHQISQVDVGPAWICRSAIHGDLLPALTDSGVLIKIARRGIAPELLKPINGDTPGDESFVTEARKSLPRKKPVTGPVTIDNRGEVVR